MPAKRRPPISVLGVLTIDGWDQRQKEFRSLLYQTQTIGDISLMSFRRNRQEGHQMTISRENVWGTCMRNYSVSVINDGDSIKSFCSKYNVDEKHVIKLYYIILIALKILIWEKTLEQLKLRNERGKKRNGHTRISLRRTSLYRIGLVGLPLFKCDEIHLRWGFTVKTTVILLKNVFEIIGLDQLWTGRTGRSSRGKVFIIYFHRISQCVPGGFRCSRWKSYGPAIWTGLLDYGLYPFSFFLLLFFYSFFFSFLVSYCSCFVSLYSQSF